MGVFSWVGKCCWISTNTRESRSQTRTSNIITVDPHKAVKKINIEQLITSRVEKESIKVSQFTPRDQDRHKYRFRCCICYSFFSNILWCSECQNYIWIFDLEKYLNSAMKESKKLNCPFCSCTSVKFKDVDPNVQKTKHYFSNSSNWKRSQFISEKDLNGSLISKVKEDSKNLSPENTNRMFRPMIKKKSQYCRKMIKQGIPSESYQSNNLSFKKQKSHSVVRYVSSCNPQGFEDTDRVINSNFANGIVRMNTVFANAQNSPLKNKNASKYLTSKLSRELPKINTQIQVIQNNILPDELKNSYSDFSNYWRDEENEDPFMTPEHSTEKRMGQVLDSDDSECYSLLQRIPDYQTSPIKKSVPNVVEIHKENKRVRIQI